jgi:hypothetical protein
MPEVINYDAVPLGTLPGEASLQAPYNLKPQNAIVRVRNLSAMRERRVIVEAISLRRGGERSVGDKKGPYFGQGVTVDALRFKAANEENVNWEEMRLEPQDFILRHDGVRILIPYPRDKSKPQEPTHFKDQFGKPILDWPALIGQPGEWVELGEHSGAWDLYMGNFERMRGDFGPRVRTDELLALNMRGQHKYVASFDNPYGFLEFERQEIRFEEAVVDAERIRSGALLEV